MAIGGIGITGYPAGYVTRKEERNIHAKDFANRMGNIASNTSTANPFSSEIGKSMKTTLMKTAMNAYLVSSAQTVRNLVPKYETYESENYRLVPDNEAGCFDIYNKQGERTGVFSYSDIKIRQDAGIENQAEDCKALFDFFATYTENNEVKDNTAIDFSRFAPNAPKEVQQAEKEATEKMTTVSATGTDIKAVTDVFGISYSGNKKVMKQFEKISKDLYIYYGVSEDDIKKKTERYLSLVTALSS